MPISFKWFGRSKAVAPVEWLFVGLGNPGKKYAQTRHNAGFHVVNRFVQSENLSFDEHRSDGLLARGIVADVPIGILKPLTYMNLSGKSVAPVARFYKVPIDKIVVILSPTAHVLQEFSKAEWELMTHTYDKAQQTILAIIQHGIEYAMNNFNC
ncbi:MAG: hypothetical protein B6242_06015 [Anaerolineaceae bacterium 4572_78]|nr:MAG: hypothetical protein B6242_06015 [Anaerolineaceae bacterium 4572_78]